ncbi:MAG TPA: T9SS type A sorting domain-containing protein [Ignavibacteria bacterium]|nr:T9SS type A sorting domain-containing protein [Ignavibacteria bacterium]
MFKRLLFSLFISILLVGSLQAGSRYTPEQMKYFSQIRYQIKLTGDSYGGQRLDAHHTNIPGTVNTPDIIVPSNYTFGLTWTGNVTTKWTQWQSFYDLASNGSTMQIWQNPSDPDELHYVQTWSPDSVTGSTSFLTRTTKYYFSSDRGVTWSFIADIVPPTGIASGFASVTGTSEGIELIGIHTNVGTPATTRGQFFYDAFPGLGSFTRLDPGLNPSSLGCIWVRMVATANVSLTNKFVFIGSVNGTDYTARNVATSLSSSAFTGFQQITDADQAETYSLARGDDGRIGIAYIGAVVDQGDVFFMESTDNGSTFSTPIKVFNRNEADTQSAGGLRGINLAYLGNSPKMVFETVAQTPSGSYFPGLPNDIRFWSSSLPGADPNRTIPIIISDTNVTIGPNGVPYAPNTGINDVFAPVCRPVIGKSGGTLFVACQVATSVVDPNRDSTCFRALYLTASGNGGSSWKSPERISPTTPQYDWVWPSMSPMNDETGSSHFLNMAAVTTSSPGSNVNGTGFTPRSAYSHYLRVEVPKPVGIENLSGVANSFSLAQNFPNPFNPSTSIRFALPNASNVVLKIYDISGKEVATLINNQVVSAGLNEVTFNAKNLASGIYFYSITAGNFKDTKKMMLIK